MPSGVILPGAPAYLDGRGGVQELYLTPRLDGLQFGWTDDGSRSPRDLLLAPDRGGRLERRSKRPKAIAVSFAQHIQDLEISLGGEYGKVPRPVPRGVALFDDRKLLRLGAHVGVQGLRAGLSIGNEIDPGDVGETVTWDALARYDRGPWSVGVVYSHTMVSDASSRDETIMRSVQAGISYSLTADVTVSINAARWDFRDEDGIQRADTAGLVGLSLRF